MSDLDIASLRQIEHLQRANHVLDSVIEDLRKDLQAQQHNAEKLAADAVATIDSSARIWRELVSDLRRENEELQIYRRAIESMAAQFIHPKTTALEFARQILGETE